MSIRSLLPKQLHEVTSSAYVAVGRTTAAIRLEPSFVLIGASRAGTTTLFKALAQHPQVVRPPVDKGVRYFDLNYDRGPNWYRAHFPIARTAALRAGSSGPPAAFEASGYYVFHPFAMQRMARDLPKAQLVVMLRDPVERAFSAWKHESARGFEWEGFERALELEDERMVGEVDRMARDVTYESFCHRHHSHRGRGEYVDQLERILKVFSRSQLHVMQFDTFIAQPEKEYARLLAFLHLRPFDGASFAQRNARPSKPMPMTTRRALEAHYAPFNHRLETLLDQPLTWA